MFGAPDANSSGVLRTVAMSSASFEASYSPPSLLTTPSTATLASDNTAKPRTNTTSLLMKGARNLGYYDSGDWSEEPYEGRNL